MEDICVLGLGYIGLPTAAMFATHGFRVLGVDVNGQVVRALENGEVHIHEPGLNTLVRAALNSGNLSQDCSNSINRKNSSIRNTFLCLTWNADNSWALNPNV